MAIVSFVYKVDRKWREVQKICKGRWPCQLKNSAGRMTGLVTGQSPSSNISNTSTTSSVCLVSSTGDDAAISTGFFVCFPCGF